MKKRMLKGMLFVCILYVVDLLVCHMYLLNNMYKKNFISESVFNENLIINDYHSLIKYSIVYMIVFLIYINYVLGNKRPEAFIRFKSRNHYYNFIYRWVLLTSFFYSSLHEAISVVLVLRYGNMELLLSHGWLSGEIFQVSACTFYYFLVFMFQEIVKGKQSNGWAQIATVLFFAGSYYIRTILIDSDWFPLKDLIPLRELCSGSCSYGQCVAGILRLMAYVVLVLVFFGGAIEKRDVMRLEKG